MVQRHRFHLLRGIVAVAGSLLAGCSGMGTLQPGLHATVQHQHQPGCRDGMCVPHCPVRPEVQGFYHTQWRRWPTPQVVDPRADGAATPVVPPRSIVPGADQESNRQEVQNLPSVDEPAVPVRPLPPPASVPTPAPAPLPPATPAPAAPPSSSPPPEDDNLFGSREATARAALVASTAAAARAGGSSEQVRFTRHMVEMLLTEHDGAVRARMIEEAGAFDTTAADAIIVGAAADPDPRVRAAACGVWERRGGPHAVRALAGSATKDPDLSVRLQAIRGLGELRDQAAVAALVPLLDDPDPAVQSRVCLALGRATGLALGSDPQKWRQWAMQPTPQKEQRWSLFNSVPKLW